MKIIDMQPEHEKLYFCCLEDWSKEMDDAGDQKEKWYCRKKDKGIKVKLAITDDGTVAGMIHYIPAEYSYIDGKDVFFILCIWVHGHKEGRGNFQKRGIGKALLKAAEQDAMESGAKAIVSWGISLPFFMRVSWFKRHGYNVIDKDGIARLLWKPFKENIEPPKFIKLVKKPGMTEGKVNVSVFVNGWCTAQNITYERIKRISSEHQDEVDFNEYFTDDRQVLNEWGISDALFIDGKAVRTGPPPTYKKLAKLVDKRIKKLK